jgi:hypothetical protein
MTPVGAFLSFVENFTSCLRFRQVLSFVIIYQQFWMHFYPDLIDTNAIYLWDLLKNILINIKCRKAWRDNQVKVLVTCVICTLY